MQVLVTGGAGFIGSHIVDSLLKKGYRVKVLDNLEPRIHPQGKPKYLAEEVEFIQGDVRSHDDVLKALAGVEAVFHYAAYQDYLPDFSKFFQVNAAGTAMVLEVIVEKGLPVKKMVVASSQAVYGEGEHLCHQDGKVTVSPRSRQDIEAGLWELKCPQCGGPVKPVPHQESFANPNNQYALSKYAQELLAIRLGRQHQVPTVALRHSITQGARQSPFNSYSGVLRIFVARLKKGLPPIIFEDGQQLRDYTHIADAVAAALLVLEKEEANYQVFNVGSGQAITVSQYALKIIEEMGKDLAPLYTREYRVGDTRHSISDITKLKALGWQPEKSLEDIIGDYLEWIEAKGEVAYRVEEADQVMRNLKVIERARDAAS